MEKAFTIINKDLTKHASFSIDEEKDWTKEILEKIQTDAVLALEREGIKKEDMIVICWDKRIIYLLKDFKLENEIYIRRETSGKDKVETPPEPEKDTQFKE